MYCINTGQSILTKNVMPIDTKHQYCQWHVTRMQVVMHVATKAMTNIGTLKFQLKI